MEISEKNFLEKLADKIPGLKGYRAKEDRRETDKRLRDYMAARLDRVKDRVDALKLELTNQGNLQALNAVGLLHRRLQRVADSIRFADYGYSGLFDQMKVRESELDRVYEHDMKILDSVEALERATADQGPDTTVAAAVLQSLDDLIADRKSLFESPASPEPPAAGP